MADLREQLYNSVKSGKVKFKDLTEKGQREYLNYGVEKGYVDQSRLTDKARLLLNPSTPKPEVADTEQPLSLQMPKTKPEIKPQTQQPRTVKDFLSEHYLSQKPANNVLGFTAGELASQLPKQQNIHPKGDIDTKLGLEYAKMRKGETNNTEMLKQKASEPFATKDMAKGENWGQLSRPEKSFVAGVGDVVSGVGSAAEWLGAENVGQSLQQTGYGIQEKYGQEYGKEFTWNSLLDPDWWATSATRSLPFTMSLIPAAVVGGYAGASAGGALGLGAFGKTVLGSLGAAGLSRPLESALEAGGTYQEALAKGYTEEEADKAANETFKNNLKLMGLDAAEFATAFMPSPIKAGAKPLVKGLVGAGKLAGAGLMEAGEEGLQEYFGKKSLDEQFSLQDPQTREAMALGGVMGVGTGMSGVAYNTFKNIQERVYNQLPNEAKAEVDVITEQNVQQGMNAEQARVKAFDEVAKIPQVQQVIEQSTKEIITELENEMATWDPNKVQQLQGQFNEMNRSQEQMTEASRNISQRELQTQDVMGEIPPVRAKTQQDRILESVQDNFGASFGEQTQSTNLQQLIQQIQGVWGENATFDQKDVVNNILPTQKQSNTGQNNQAQISPVSNQQTTPIQSQAQRPEVSTGQKQQPTQTKQPTMPIEERTFEEVGDGKVKAYQYEHPEVADYIQAEGTRVLTELYETQPGKRDVTVNKETGEKVVTQTPRIAGPTIERIKEATGASYKQIEDALQRIINDNGQENQALAKRIELILNDNLTQSTTSFDGYVNTKARIEGQVSGARQQQEKPVQKETVKPQQEPITQQKQPTNDYSSTETSTNNLQKETPINQTNELSTNSDITLADYGLELINDGNSWLIKGNTYEHKDEIKKLGARWDGKEKAWSISSKTDPTQDIIDVLEGGEPNERSNNKFTRLDNRISLQDIKNKEYGKITVTRGKKVVGTEKQEISQEIKSVLKQHQIDGVHLAITAIDNYGGFLLADGTGAGKTMQELVVADYYAKQGNKTLIVTTNETNITNSFMPQAKMLDIKVSVVDKATGKLNEGINIITYTSLGKIKDNANYIIFDEAHYLKNYDKSKQAKTGLAMADKAKGVIFASATPLDKAHHLKYLTKLGIFDKITFSKMMNKLGYKYRERKLRNRTFGEWILQGDAEEAANKLEKFFDELSNLGLMIKREVSMDNVEILFDKIELPQVVHEEMDEIDEHYQKREDLNSGLRKALSLMTQRKIQEPHKIKSVLEITKQEIAKNRKVVIFATRVEDTKKGASEDVSEGTLKKLSQELKNKGYTVSEIFGSGKVDKEINNFQKGTSQVAVVTPQKGGAGLSLDDTVGSQPRTMIIITPPFSATENVQMVGRINRLDTKSKSRVVFMMADTSVDTWNKEIIENKMQTLNAVVKGDISKLLRNENEELEIPEEPTKAEKTQQQKELPKERATKQEVEPENTEQNQKQNQEQAKPTYSKDHFKNVSDFNKKMKNLDYTAADIKAHYQYLLDNKDVIIEATLEKIKADPKLKRKRNNTKQQMAEKHYNDALTRLGYAASYSLQYNPMEPNGLENTIARVVENLTEDHVQEYLAEQKAKIKTKQKAFDNPETLKEFQEKKVYKGLTKEEQIKYEELLAEQQKEPQKTTAVSKLQVERQKEVAGKLRTVADNMQSTIDDKFADRLANTARRANMAANAIAEGEKLQAIQKIMYNLSDAIEKGEVKHLDGITARTHVETLQNILGKLHSDWARNGRYEDLKNQPMKIELINEAQYPKPTLNVYTLKDLYEATEGLQGVGQSRKKIKKLIDNKPDDSYSIDLTYNMEDVNKLLGIAKKNGKWSNNNNLYGIEDYKRLQAMGIETEAQLRAALREFFQYRKGTELTEEQKREIKIKEIERNVVNSKIEGFFPTPGPVVDKMIKLAEIEPGDEMLEPSAGKGNIADKLQQTDGKLSVIEYNNSLRELLDFKGHNIVGQDFLEHEGQYEKIIMNPPFEKGQDIEHVRHAYKLLKPGGRVVAIMSEGPFFRGDKKASEFREWLNEAGGVSEKLPGGTFKDSERSTGVNTRIVVIEKPAENESIKGIEKKLADRVNEEIGDDSKRLGILPNAYKKSSPSGFEWSNPEVEQRYKANEGMKPEGKIDKFLEKITRLRHQMTREFEHLPKTGEFSKLRFTLHKLLKQRDVAGYRTLKMLQGFIVKLDSKQYDLFKRKVIIDDQMAELKAEGKLSFGWAEDTLIEDYNRLEKELESHPLVKEAINERKKTWRALTDELLKSTKAIGLDLSNKLTKENYFRHQVIAKAQENRLKGTGKKLKTPAGRGYQKTRETGADFNTEYLQAEYEVMSQMLYDIEVAKAIKEIDKQYNIKNQLKIESAKMNDARIMSVFEMMSKQLGAEVDPSKLYRQKLNWKQSIGFSRLSEMALRDELPDTTDGRFEYVINTLKTKSKVDEEQIEGVKETDIIKYLAWLLKEAEGEAKTNAALVFKGIQEKKQFIKNTLGDKYVTWEDLIPEGYTVWQPREGRIMYMADSIPSQKAEELFSGALEQLGVTQEDLRKVFAIGQRYKEFVVKEEIAETLDNLKADKGDSIGLLRDIQTAWKVWVLLSPRRMIKYNLRNITGDADALLAGNPSAFKKVPQAVRELYGLYAKDKSMTQNMQDWFERGGMQTLLQVQEQADINKLRMFNKVLEQKNSNISKKPNMLETYWKTARLSTDFREAILRYAAYLDYLEQMQNNKKIPKNFGASIKEEVLALDDIKDRAFKLSNDLLGAYDQISIVGQKLREKVYPFWSWVEVNATRYVQLIKNAADSNEIAEMVGRKLLGTAVKSPLIALRVGKLAIKATGLWVLLSLWNVMVFGDLEDGLPEEEKKKPHIILGKDEEGNIIYFNRLGALADFVEWFGVDAGTVNDIQSILNGQQSVKDVAKEMAKEPVNKIVQGVNPVIKLFGELPSGRKFFPDVFRPGTIRDRGLHIAQNLGLTNEYKQIMGLPDRAYDKTLRDIFVYTTNPQQNIYYSIVGKKYDYLEKIGRKTDGFMRSPKSDALYNFKAALRYKDKEAAKKYLFEYISLGGTGDGLNRSLQTLHPLWGLSKNDTESFLSILTDKELENLNVAISFYHGLISEAVQEKDYVLEGLPEKTAKSVDRKLKSLERKINKQKG